MNHMVSFTLKIRDDDSELTNRLAEILKPENDQTILIETQNNNELTIKCERIKANSLYSLVDEFLNAYEIVKQI